MDVYRLSAQGDGEPAAPVRLRFAAAERLGLGKIVMVWRDLNYHTGRPDTAETRHQQRLRTNFSTAVMNWRILRRGSELVVNGEGVPHLYDAIAQAATLDADIPDSLRTPTEHVVLPVDLKALKLLDTHAFNTPPNPS